MPVGPQIVGISLVRNEDLYIERVLLNILEFCDRIRVLGIGSEPSAWKLKHYMLGELVEKDVTQFFLERD